MPNRSQIRVAVIGNDPSYAQVLDALAPLAHWPLTELSGTIADNARYTAAPGPQAIVDSEMDNLGWWTENVTGPDTIVWGSSIVTLTRATANVTLSRGSFATAGDTWQFDAKLNSSTGIFRVADGNGTPRAIDGTDLGAGVFSGQMIFSSTSVNGAWQATNGTTEVDYVRGWKVGELDALIAGATTLAQTGIRGPNHAYLFDGATSLLTVYNRASIQGMSNFTLSVLFKLSSYGEITEGRLFEKASSWYCAPVSATGLLVNVNYGTTPIAETLTLPAGTLALDVWHSLSFRVTDPTKTLDVFIDGVKYTAASGAGSVPSTTNNLIIGNRAAADRTMAGLMDEFAPFDRAITDAEARLFHVASMGVPVGSAASSLGVPA